MAADSDEAMAWLERTYGGPRDPSQLDATRFTRWNMVVAYCAGKAASSPTVTEEMVKRGARTADPKDWARVDLLRKAAIDYRENPDLDEHTATQLEADCERKANNLALPSLARARACLTAALAPEEGRK
jgi:hypothetical protein